MRCELCGKRFMVANHVSHSNSRTKRRQGANIQRVRTVRDGRACRMQVCTRCIRSGMAPKP